MSTQKSYLLLKLLKNWKNIIKSSIPKSLRYFYPDQEGIYSWWSYRFKAREKNAGWRIDYFMVSESLKERMKDAKIHTEIMGSDHCPIELDLLWYADGGV